MNILYRNSYAQVVLLSGLGAIVQMAVLVLLVSLVVLPLSPAFASEVEQNADGTTSNELPIEASQITTDEEVDRVPDDVESVPTSEAAETSIDNAEPSNDENGQLVVASGGAGGDDGMNDQGTGQELGPEGSDTTGSGTDLAIELASSTVSDDASHTEAPLVEGVSTDTGASTDSGVTDDTEASDSGSEVTNASSTSNPDITATEEKTPNEISTSTVGVTEVSGEAPLDEASATSSVSFFEDPDTLGTTDHVTVSTTSTESFDVEMPEVSVSTNSENKYQFSETECVTVGDGSFYCAKNKQDQAFSEREDGLFSLPDADGDAEIYVVKDGVETQITKNLFDDMAPYYDSSSDRIVWHRLIDGRYQIVTYSVADDIEQVLTNTDYNNMEPTAYGDITVWQGWIGDDWEILMSENTDITQLTDNDVHDVAPYINKDYVVWQTQVGDKWYMSLYDRDTGEIERIENENNAFVENPRFVLVYDAHLENGDVQTLGYDLETKKVTPLSSAPAPIPSDIPEPDQTGEERALIQNKPPSKEDVVEQDTDAASGGEPPANEGTGSSTASTAVATSTSDVGTIVIPPFGEESADSSMIVEPPIEPLVIQESTISNAEAAQTENFEHIDDVVIPEYVPVEEPSIL